jgi:hypothetical protein
VEEEEEEEEEEEVSFDSANITRMLYKNTNNIRKIAHSA